MTEQLWACDWCATVQCRETEPARCYSGECKDRRGVHAFSVITAGSLVFPAPQEVTPPAPSPAERRAELVKKCKAVCPKCAEWSFDAKDARWAIVYELDSDSACTDIRREIAKLDAEEAAKAKAPPAPDDALKAEALALASVWHGVASPDWHTLQFPGCWLALAREVRRQKADELEAIVMEPCDSHTSKLYDRIAKLRGEQHGK